MNPDPVCVSQKPKEVRGCMETQQALVQELLAKTSRLESELSDILVASSPPAEEAKRPSMAVPLSSMIDETNYQISCVLNQLSQILGRLEL